MDSVFDKPLVSAIMIFFNGEKYIEEAIESVFSQTYGNWELLLVDDGSTDRSTEIAQGYAKQLSDKVCYFEHEGHTNRGMSATRNLGISQAQGEYIAFLDSDDVWLPQKLERQVAIAQAQPDAAMVYGATQYWHSWTGKSEDAKCDYVPRLGIPGGLLYGPPELSTLLYPLGAGTAPCPSDLLMRRSMVNQVGGFEEHFQGKYQLYEDQGFLAKVYLQYPVFVSDETWDRYRIHPDSCMASATRAGDYWSVRAYFLRWFKGYLNAQRDVDRRVHDALDGALRQCNDPALTVASKPAERSLLEVDKASMPSAEVAGTPSVHEVEFGSLRRVTPISRNWGFDRGRPVDRYYIESFLAQCATDIRGRVVEVGDDSYTRRFGGNRVTKIDVLHATGGHPQATIVADVTSADHIPSNAFDCIILTQTLQFIYDVSAAIKTLYRILAPQGVILATFPGISQTYDREWGSSWYWNFTPLSARRLFEEQFLEAEVTVETRGNVLTATSFLYGLAEEELTPEELDYYEPGYDVSIAVRAVKPGPFAG